MMKTFQCSPRWKNIFSLKGGKSWSSSTVNVWRELKLKQSGSDDGGSAFRGKRLTCGKCLLIVASRINRIRLD